MLSNHGYSSPYKQKQIEKMNGDQHVVSSPGIHNRKREKGVVEKLLNSYGFLECSSTNYRVFFHYSEYDGDINKLVVGDCIEFSLTTDHRNNKPLAVNLSKLPSGSVVIETLSEEMCTGRVEVEPKVSKNADSADISTLGRVSYDKSGEFFFLPFSISDIEKGEKINKGDYVSFHVATNKRTGSMKARKLRLSSTQPLLKIGQGIVSSLKENFGFIERADTVAEIFFHYSEFKDDINELLIGDDVEYELQERAGKETAVNIKKLPTGTVVFEDISPTRYKGHVIKAISSSPGTNVDGHLTGMIEYQGKNDTHEILFGDRDTEDDIMLQKGDIVEFNVSTDRRDKLQRAVNIKLISVCVPNGHTRDIGIISSLKDGFGFIKCAEQELSIFFHFSEVLEQSRVMNIGDEVEFTIQNDVVSKRQHATRVHFLPKGSVTFETVSSKRYVGIIEQEAPLIRNMKSPNKVKEQENGFIQTQIGGVQTRVAYYLRDCKLRETPQYQDKVDFILVTKKASGHHFARDVNVLEKAVHLLQQGYVCALKESFGFIEVSSHERELFFHFSAVTDGTPLELGDLVQFTEVKSGEKISADNVTKLPLSSFTEDDVTSNVYEGTVIRPMRTVDPDQSEYEGLIQVSSTEHENDEKEEVYRFGITSLVDKKEQLQVGNKVSFQTYIDSVTKTIRATRVACKRNILRGRVESLKGQFGFISYDNDEGKRIFFHMSELIDIHSSDLRTGDEVSFSIVNNHKNGKKSAIRVQKVIDERPERLARRRSVRFSECAASSFVVLRHPTGPDGTSGFKLLRDVDVMKEQLSELDLSCS